VHGDQWIEGVVIVIAAEFGATNLHSIQWVLGGGGAIATIKISDSNCLSLILFASVTKAHSSIDAVYC